MSHQEKLDYLVALTKDCDFDGELNLDAYANMSTAELDHHVKLWERNKSILKKEEVNATAAPMPSSSSHSPVFTKGPWWTDPPPYPAFKFL